MNFLVLVLCSQFAFAFLAMKGAFLPQLLELWQISKTQFGVLMSLYGITHNIFYVAFSWAQDRFSPRVLIPANMIFGGITTFFFGQTADFATLCFLFVMLSLWCEGAFWPAVLASVRKSTSDSNQGKIFGVLESGRGVIELGQNMLTVGLYTALGYSLLGLEVAFMVNAVIMIVLGVIAFVMLPKETLLKSHDSGGANREVKAGMLVMLKLPEVWLAGILGFTVYVAYTTMPFFLTHLNDTFALPVLAVTIFGIASTSGGRITIALPAGFIADTFLGGPSGGMRFGLVLVAVLSIIMMLLPEDPDYAIAAMVTMMLLAFAFFFMRALYFAPFGEMGLPPRFSGSAMAIAAFVIYLPSSFAYALWGVLIDSGEQSAGYDVVFGVLLVISIVGVCIATVLKRRIDSGASKRIAADIAVMDGGLGLSGEEKTLSELIDSAPSKAAS